MDQGSGSLNKYFSSKGKETMQGMVAEREGGICNLERVWSPGT